MILYFCEYNIVDGHQTKALSIQREKEGGNI